MNVTPYNAVEPITNFNQLPPELKVKVLAFLPPSDLVCNARVTCRSWKELSESQILWAEAARLAFEIAPGEKEKTILRTDLRGEQQSVNVLCKAASEGSKRAQKELLDILENLEMTLDSCALFTNLSSQGNPWAKYCLATIYLTFGSAYCQKALALLEEAKNKGLLIAQFLLATYEDKPACEADLEMIEDLVKRNYHKALLYQADRETDAEKQKELILRAFAADDQDAEVLYRYGMSLNDEEKISFLIKSMDQGFIQAGIDLAEMLKTPYEIKNPHNPAELACKLHQMHLEISEDWDAPVNFELQNCVSNFEKDRFALLPYFFTLMFLSGEVLGKNEQHALFWFKQMTASRGEEKLAEYIDYESLDSKIENYPDLSRKIVAFYTQKANAGKGYYLYKLAEVYEQGKFGIHRDLQMALALYEQSADTLDFDGITGLYLFHAKNGVLNEKKLETLRHRLEMVPAANLQALYSKLSQVPNMVQ